MGCCASSNYKSAPAPPKRLRSSSSRSSGFRHSAEAPPHPEEETVKEVLSETANPKPAISKIEDEDKKIGFMPSLHKIREIDGNVEKKPPLVSTEDSEVSENCSLSESVFTGAEKRENGGGEFRRRMEGSPARRPMAGKSPARRVEPDPSRVRPVPGRDRRSVAADGPRRDFGEISGRRSRSPAARAVDGGGARAGLGRSPSARKTGKSPSRVRSELNEKTRNIEDSNRWAPPTTNESLENPLVSLECFIFL
ncbi:hypothetical protein Acr_08g0002310 [Actinidia rufa]|uniref:Uncharacterized protein n=1 Tax=Actinidia rufa TaxID=165716 RepID=A0A7J0EZG4_9ERIC|nr:hypothetical protein Acr_08g0002310 [Actinidia rufa]